MAADYDAALGVVEPTFRQRISDILNFFALPTPPHRIHSTQGSPSDTPAGIHRIFGHPIRCQN
jgi:hypothetical protein